MGGLCMRACWTFVDTIHRTDYFAKIGILVFLASYLSGLLWLVNEMAESSWTVYFISCFQNCDLVQSKTFLFNFVLRNRLTTFVFESTSHFSKICEQIFLFGPTKCSCRVAIPLLWHFIWKQINCSPSAVGMVRLGKQSWNWELWVTDPLKALTIPCTTLRCHLRTVSLSPTIQVPIRYVPYDLSVHY